MPSTANKNLTRSEMARKSGRKTCAFDISNELDAIIDAVVGKMAASLGRCTRIMALERAGRLGAAQILNGKVDPLGNEPHIVLSSPPEPGRKTCAFEISDELDALIDAVAEKMMVDLGRCSRNLALERMARLGAAQLLSKAK